MAKPLIPEELDALIQEYLTDGIITAKERQVLLNKAAQLGLNVDEIDLYIDAQQQKADQQVDAAVKKQRGQTCPYCAGSIPQLADKCPHCGQHISAEASDELKEIIENLEESLVDFKSGKDFARSKANVEKYIRKAQLYYSNNPKIQTLIAEVKAESEIAEKKAKSDATKKTLVKILTYNKWITIIVILLLIVGIISAIRSCQGPDPSTDAQACIQQIEKALSNDDVAKAEGLFSSYKLGKAKVTPGGIYIVEYYIEHDNLDKAAAMAKNLDYSEQEIYEGKVADAYIEKGEYEKAESIGVRGFISDSKIPFFSKVVKHMKKSGASKAELESYITGVVARANIDKDAIETSLNALIEN